MHLFKTAEFSFMISYSNKTTKSFINCYPLRSTLFYLFRMIPHFRDNYFRLTVWPFLDNLVKVPAVFPWLKFFAQPVGLVLFGSFHEVFPRDIFQKFHRRLRYKDWSQTSSRIRQNFLILVFPFLGIFYGRLELPLG